MELTLLKLVLTPALIAASSLAARRWGPIVGGWLVALPLTSGPVALFLALERSPSFAAAAAHASLAGCLPIALFGLLYARFAPTGWPKALAVASAGWLAGALGAVAMGGWPVELPLAVAVGSTLAAIALLPAVPERSARGRSDGRELVARMVAGTIIVVAVTGLAPVVGPTLAGLLAMVPVIGSVLTVFSQRADGPGAAIGIWRGILSGLIGTAGFLAVLEAGLTRLAIGPAFGAALLAMVLVQAAAILVLPREGPPASPGWPTAPRVEPIEPR